MWKNKAFRLTVAVAFWLIVWQLASLAVNETLFLPSPVQVLASLGRLTVTARFWQSVAGSLGRIALGFFLGLVVGVLLAWASAALDFVRVLISPLMQLVRATPVASFIILALVWINSRNLSVFISFLMVLPVLYGATYSGIAQADTKLLEMTKVFRVGFWRRLRAVYLPALMPGLMTACELALGMAWKSGVAAEVIGLPDGSIGERLYQAKIFLQMPELFAWTVVIILVSWVFARAVLWLLRALGRRVTGGAVT